MTMAMNVNVNLNVTMNTFRTLQDGSMNQNMENKEFMYFLLGSASFLMALVICGMGCGPDISTENAEHDYRYQVSDNDSACRAHESYIAVVTGACAPHSAESFDSNTNNATAELTEKKRQAYLAAVSIPPFSLQDVYPDNPEKCCMSA